MSLRPATTEEVQKIKGTATPAVSPENSTHSSYKTLRVTTQGTGTQKSQLPEKDESKPGFLKSIVAAPLTMVARPIQAVAALGGVSDEAINKFSEEKLGGFVAPTPQNFKDVKKDVGRAAETVALGLGPLAGGAVLGAGSSLEQGNDLFSAETAISTALGLGAGKVLGLVGKPLLDATGKVIGKITPQELQNVASKGTKAIEEFAARHKILPDKVSTAINKGADALENGLNKPFDYVATQAKKLAPKPESILNRSNRLNPTDAQTFEKQFGESHGAYLEKTGNFNSPEETVVSEAKKFKNSLKEVDTALETLPGVYKNENLGMMLSELGEREASIGLPNQQTRRISDLTQKHKSQGLTMKETNEIKGLYERNVRTGYLKDPNNRGTNIERATRLDSAVREWQVAQADTLGFKNLRALNEQTRKAKFIIDKLGKKLSGQVGNNEIDLTDYILLAGGDPLNVSSFLIKKLFSNKGIQAKVAKQFSKVPKIEPIKADLEYPNRGLPDLIPGRDYRTSIEMRGEAPKPTPTTVEPRAQNVNRSSSLPDQKLLPAGPEKTQVIPGETIRLPRNAREEYLGISSSKPQSPQLSEKRLPKSYESSVSRYTPDVQKFIQGEHGGDIKKAYLSAFNADNPNAIEKKFMSEYIKNNS